MLGFHARVTLYETGSVTPRTGTGLWSRARNNIAPRTLASPTILEDQLKILPVGFAVGSERICMTNFSYREVQPRLGCSLPPLGKTLLPGSAGVSPASSNFWFPTRRRDATVRSEASARQAGAPKRFMGKLEGTGLYPMAKSVPIA